MNQKIKRGLLLVLYIVFVWMMMLMRCGNNGKTGKVGDRRLYQWYSYLFVALFQRLLRLVDHFTHLTKQPGTKIPYFLHLITQWPVVFTIITLQLVEQKMKAVFYHLSFLFVSVASAMPITSIRGIIHKLYIVNTVIVDFFNF